MRLSAFIHILCLAWVMISLRGTGTGVGFPILHDLVPSCHALEEGGKVQGWTSNPMSPSPNTQVHYMFVTLGLNRAWVLKDGSLTGVVTKRDLIDMDL